MNQPLVIPEPAETAQESGAGSMTLQQAGWRALLASLAFQCAFEFGALNFLVLPGAYLLVTLSRVSSSRVAFRLGFASGLLVFGPQLAWFWRIFGPVAICLWAVLAAFIGLFTATIRIWRVSYGVRWLWLAIPVSWTGLEYFRSELYYLRFSWLSAGYAFSERSGRLPVGLLGVYGLGFVLCLIAGLADQAGKKARLWLGTGSVLIIILSSLPPGPNKSTSLLRVAGIQLEFPPDLRVTEYLDRVDAKFPSSDLLVLSEYTFDGPVPKRVREWCRQHRKYLIAGGKADGEEGGFYNSAFVVGPTGEIEFEQAKSAPIQFFKDGLPARQQNVWSSPWGKIGICVCYDLSYRKVTDRLVQQGAQAIIVPFMDISEWGTHQHEMHSRVGPLRAREYRLPIFRLGSSGISQLIDADGRVLESAPFPGQEEIVGGNIELGPAGRLPLDSRVAPLCSVATAAFLLCRLAMPFLRRLGTRRQTSSLLS